MQLQSLNVKERRLVRFKSFSNVASSRRQSIKEKGLRRIPSAPSIPSKFESRKKDDFLTKANTGFGSSTERFDERITFNPGPGHYHKPTSYLKNAKRCGSVSTRGFTALISRDPRFSDMKELTDSILPGPGAYSPSISAIHATPPAAYFSGHSFVESRGNSKSKIDNTPGPGQYEKSLSKRRLRISNIGAASFKFTARKSDDILIPQQSNAAVGSYEVGKSLDYIQNIGREPRRGKPFPDPIFSSTTKRLAPSEINLDIPGPGHYFLDPYETYEMYRPSPVFLDRSGESNKVSNLQNSLPGPGAYDPNDPNQNTHCRANASFHSTSSRFQSNQGTEKHYPGPGMMELILLDFLCLIEMSILLMVNSYFFYQYSLADYNPMPIVTKSFLLNRNGQWI